jgi:prepilin-type N-terminal cleavage/methylation domain-containing protein
MSRLRAQEGMTLVEVLVALTITLIVSLATFALIGVVMTRAGEIGSRVDTTQRGRQAMDFITRQLRSQVCVQRTGELTDDRAVYAATPLSVTFFSDLGDESIRTGNTIKAPDLRSLSLESGKLLERIWAGTAVGTGITQTVTYTGYPASGATTRQILDSVGNIETTGSSGTGTPLVFRYYKYDTATPPQPSVEMDASAGLTIAQLQQVARITVSFRAIPSRGKATDRAATVLTANIYVRSADPNSKTPRPVCS